MGDAEDVIAIEEHWPQALARRDRAWLEAHTAADFVFITPDGTVVERETYLQRSSVGNDAVVSRSNEADLVRVFGDVAVVIGRLGARLRDPAGHESELRYRYSSVYVRERGAWLASTAQLTSLADSS